MTQLDLPSAEQKWRAKLYELESTGSWLDQGTGYVALVINSTTLHCPALVMVSEEEDGKVLLESKIQSDEQYEKQGGTAARSQSYSNLLRLMLCNF